LLAAQMAYESMKAKRGYNEISLKESEINENQ